MSLLKELTPFTAGVCDGVTDTVVSINVITEAKFYHKIESQISLVEINFGFGESQNSCLLL